MICEKICKFFNFKGLIGRNAFVFSLIVALLERDLGFKSDKILHIIVKELKDFVKQGQLGDEAVVTNLNVLGRNSGECTKMLYRLMHAGITLDSLQEKLRLTVRDYKGFLPVFATMYGLDQKKRRQEQREGIEQAKERGVYHGRKKLSTDEELFRNIALRFRNKEIPLEEALEITGFSKSTFYRRMRELL